MNKNIIHLLLAAALLSGCAERKSPLDAEARDAGTRAAAALIAVDHSDTSAMERAIFEIKARQSEFAIKRDSLAVRAFDQAFKVYLQEYDKPLYQAIFPDE